MVITKVKDLKARILLKNRHDILSAHDVQGARNYVGSYWVRLTRDHPNDDDSLLGLPHPYLVPAYEEDHEFDFNELYYWDSYFMVQGMLKDHRSKELVIGILEDLLSLYARFKIIPNASRTYLTGRSQPPFLTSFIIDVYNAYGMNKHWLDERITVAQDEYYRVWMGTRKPNARQVYEGLSRYYDINHLNDLAEAESGWDHTTRFNRKCLNYLPVDLNALLFKYEMDFAQVALLLGRKTEASAWEEAARWRQVMMNKLMWSDFKGLYYDYNYVKKQRGNVDSLAAYYPMWAGMVNQKQAAQLVSSLRRFEEKGGLVTTNSTPLTQLTPSPIPAQWAHPNGWAPLQFIAVKGLQRYGYHDDARRIAHKWLKCNLDWFNTHGVFLEKYNVVSPDKPPARGVYPSQVGFGWTNAVFERLCQDFIDKKG